MNFDPLSIFTNPIPSTIIEEVKVILEKEDEIDVRTLQDWSYLADKIVGQEE